MIELTLGHEMDTDSLVEGVVIGGNLAYMKCECGVEFQTEGKPDFRTARKEIQRRYEAHVARQ